jgi:hypothetical protein
MTEMTTNAPQHAPSAALIEAAPDLLQAAEQAVELIKTARRYFPKSVKHRDKFDLELTCAVLGSAIHKAKS